MKLLLDENLSPELAKSLSDLYSGSAHVHECGLGSTDDEQIWAFAKANGFVIVSKDSDFRAKSLLQGAPPKVVWLRIGNCTTQDLEELLRKFSAAIHTFETSQTECFLVLP